MAVAINLLPQFAENIKNNKITHVKNFCKKASTSTFDAS